MAAKLADLIAERREVGNEYDEVNEQLKKLKDRRDALDQDIIDAMVDAGLDRTAIKGLANVAVAKRETVNVTNWEAIHRYILETQQVHLLQRRIMGNAILELIKDGEVIEGVEIKEIPTLSFRRA